MEGLAPGVLPSGESVTFGVWIRSSNSIWRPTVILHRTPIDGNLSQHTERRIGRAFFDLCQHTLDDSCPFSHLIEAHASVLTESL